MTKTTKYPVGLAKTSVAKTGFLYRLQELLRLEHNKKGVDYKKGLLTKKQWTQYLKTDFNPKSEEISREILKQRTYLKGDGTYVETTDNYFEV